MCRDPKTGGPDPAYEHLRALHRDKEALIAEVESLRETIDDQYRKLGRSAQEKAALRKLQGLVGKCLSAAEPANSDEVFGEVLVPWGLWDSLSRCYREVEKLWG